MGHSGQIPTTAAPLGLSSRNNNSEVVERTLARLRLSQEGHCQSNDPFIQNYDDALSPRYAPIFCHVTPQSEFYPSDDPYYTPSSMVVMQAMVIEAFNIE
ncbi:hypothetical protein RND71_023339 [Anisodus tanguticus]|uniref:Uncharacterized protein n=1 Tax=Anisodus tanguticus TaxID=243964 RepID=A0AAE1VDP4_9SOLA|nr:hypothetical protein RND71_023339 [Anisodus tanguticus]